MKFIFSLLAALALVLTGCTSTTNTTENWQTTLNVAAYVGTTEAIFYHREWRNGFAQASADLDTLASAPSISIKEILAIVNRLDVKELKSPHARLVIGASTLMLVRLNNGEILNAKTTEDLRPWVVALRDGILQGLNDSP